MAGPFRGDTAIRLAALCETNLRAPESQTNDGTGDPVFVFVPVLTTAEQATYADLLALAKSGYSLTLAEYQALKPSLATMRTFQQQTQSDFIALTQNARDRALFDLGNAHTKLLRALLRD